MSISVCMATHNGSRFIGEQVDSILPQLTDRDELVVSDDDSHDGLRDILEGYRDPRVRLLPARQFGSPARNFEYALAQCRNEYIFLADQDDVWYPNKIRLMSERLAFSDLVVCDCRLTDSNLQTLAPSFFAWNRSRAGIWKNLIRSSYMGCCMAFHRRVLDRALPFPTHIPIHDQWIGLVAERFYRTEFLPTVLLDHRRHQDNYSSTGERSKHSLFKKMEIRLTLTKQLFIP